MSVIKTKRELDDFVNTTYQNGDLIKRMEEAEKARISALESEEKLRLVIESVGEGVAVTDLNGIIKGGNKAAIAMHGFTTESEIIGLDAFQLLAKQERARALQTLRKTLITGNSGLLEYTCIKKDGSEFPVELSVSLIKDVMGKPTGFVATSRDITERKRAELALRESEQRYRYIFESANDIIVVLDRKGKILEVNSKILEIAGYEKKDLVGHDFRKLASITTKKSLALMAFNYAKRLTGMNVPAYEVEMYKKNREIINIEINAVPLIINDKIVGDLAILRDITQRKRSIQSVKESEEKFSKAFQCSPNACSISRLRDGGYLEINNSFSRITGYNKEEIIGSTARKLNLWADERDGEKIRPILRKLGILNGEEIAFRTKTGEIRRGVYSGEIIKLGGEDCVLVTIIDITERKRMENELRDAMIKADAANQTKSDFLARMSHEIRTPIHGVMGTLDLLRDTELGKEQFEYVNLARTSANTLLNVINQILDFSKIEAGKIELEEVYFDLRKVAEEALSTVAVLAHKKGLEILLQVSRDVPLNLVGDAMRLCQVLINLLANAVKFTEQGEIVLHVDVEANSRKEVELHFSVSDTGIGIPKEKQDVLFQPFEQIDGSNHRKYGGTGLGLSICKQLVNLMSGRIWFTSRLKEGSVFHFTAKFDKMAATERVDDIAEITREMHGARLLLVDDNATCRSIIRNYLNDWGFKVTEADSSDSALKELEKARGNSDNYRIILLDKGMPTMNGLDTTEKIINDPALKNCIILMLSSDNINNDFTKCQELGIFNYLIKPIKKAELKIMILKVLGQEKTESKPREQAMPVHSNNDTPHLNILVAEDNTTSQLIAKRTLEKAGHTIQIAGNGVEAVRMYNEGRFDLVLMDVEMPEINGLEATKLIRETEKGSNQHIPIIAMTAYAMKDDRQRCLDAGMDTYVSKPVNLDKLHDIIRGLFTSNNNGTPLADIEAALKFVGGDEEILKEVIGVFLEKDYPEQIKRLKDGINRNDAQAVKMAAHSIKGVVRSCSSNSLGDLTLRLEEMGRNNDLTGAETAFQELEKGMEQFAGYYSRYILQKV